MGCDSATELSVAGGTGRVGRSEISMEGIPTRADETSVAELSSRDEGATDSASAGETISLHIFVSVYPRVCGLFHLYVAPVSIIIVPSNHFSLDPVKLFT